MKRSEAVGHLVVASDTDSCSFIPEPGVKTSTKEKEEVLKQIERLESEVEVLKQKASKL